MSTSREEQDIVENSLSEELLAQRVNKISSIIDTEDLRLDPSTPALVTAAYVKEITLALYNHNRTKAAKALGISVRTLRNKLQTYFNQ